MPSRGGAHFYGDNDALAADLGKHEGGVPQNEEYWFAARDCERLELLQIEAIDHRVQNEMIFYDEKKRRRRLRSTSLTVCRSRVMLSLVFPGQAQR